MKFDIGIGVYGNDIVPLNNAKASIKNIVTNEIKFPIFIDGTEVTK